VGDHETLDQAITGYLEAEDVRALYGKVLERFERDFERERPGLVRDTMRLLWAARRGLSETELLQLLGAAEPLPRAHFSPLYLAAQDWFVAGSGLLRFTQPELRAVIEERYLPTEEERRAVHLALARYFGDDPFAPRAVDELPWQLVGGEDWASLGRLLSNAEFLRGAWRLTGGTSSGTGQGCRASRACASWMPTGTSWSRRKRTGTSSRPSGSC